MGELKKFKMLALLLVGISLLFCNCIKDEDATTYWYNYGTYYQSDESTLGFIFDLDSGKKLIPTEASGLSSNIADSSRFLLEYTKNSETEESISAKITGAQYVLTKGIMQLTPEIADSIGNDGVLFTEENVWFSDYHLNIMFSYYGYDSNIKHSINLVKPIGDQLDENGNQILEFKHNANGDQPRVKYSGVVSFNMLSIYEPDIDSINFVLKWTNYDNDTNSVASTFYFNQENDSKSAVIDDVLIQRNYK